VGDKVAPAGGKILYGLLHLIYGPLEHLDLKLSA
jgi:hypothetical protein